MRFDPTPLTDKLEAQMRELNEFFDRFQLRGGIHRGFVRIFNEGDVPGFHWNKGGRLYSQGPDNFQLMPPEDRLRMTIDGEPVCEIDIRASYLTIFHAWHGVQLDLSTDPYVLPGLGQEARDIAKLWFVATFGNDGQLTKWPKEIVKGYRERTGRRLGKDYPIKKVRDAAIKAFPLLARWGDQNRGWADLMYLESEAMIGAMLDLKHDFSAPTLAVHDSLIVPASKRASAEERLAARYCWHAKAIPTLVPHTAHHDQATTRKPQDRSEWSRSSGNPE
jgi:hypothetical protein